MGELAVIAAVLIVAALLFATWIQSSSERSGRDGTGLWALWWLAGFGLSPIWATLAWFVWLVMSNHIASGGEGFTLFFAVAACVVTVPVGAIGFVAFGRRGSSGERLRRSLVGGLLLSLGLAAVLFVLYLRSS